MCPIHIVMAMIIITLIVILTKKPTEFLIEPAVGEQGYVRFYGDFAATDLIFRMDGSKKGDLQPVYFKYDIKSEARSMDINVPSEGAPGRKVEIWARYPYSNIGTTLTDFYNIYNIPDYDYKVHPNMKLITTVLPGQRFTSDNIIPSKRFLIVANI